jgi:phage anti-repressor protein
MTNEKGKEALPHFYSRVLISDDYTENIDYKQITKYNDLVKFYEISRAPKLESKKVAHNKKYYAITGDTYKDLLQKSANKKGKQARKYYHKVEQLAIFMKDYINAMHKHNLEKQLAEKDVRINRIYI